MSSLVKQAYRRKEFCEAFGVGKHIYYSALKSGMLRSVKIGRARLVTAEAAAAWLQLCAEGTAPLRTAETARRSICPPRKVRKGG